MSIDRFLDRFTTYRLTLYYLLFLLIVSLGLSIVGVLPYSPWSILLCTIVALSTCFLANSACASLFSATTNRESVFITALILVLILPPTFPENTFFLFLASIFAMASKYLLTVERQHLFNPAAVAAVGITLLFPHYAAAWWMGTPVLLPAVLGGGLLLARRVERTYMIFVFVVAYLFLTILAAYTRSSDGSTIVSSLLTVVFRSPLWFLGFIMLTEPLTAPTRRSLRLWYALFVAGCMSLFQFHIPFLSFPPETALCLGNIFAYLVTPRYRLLLPLERKIRLAQNTFLFSFRLPGPLSFLPGQYMEWTLPHTQVDERGNRRYFSILSPPGAPTLDIGVKFYEGSSSYKKALALLTPGQSIIASQLVGDFVLPRHIEKTPLVFLAGGIGITPFLSMIQDILHRKKHSDIVVLYANKTEDDIAGKALLEQAREYGVHTLYTLTDIETISPSWQGLTGMVSTEMIQTSIPFFTERTFYISGPQAMVLSLHRILRTLDIPRHRIRTDYFPGFGNSF